ncbi:Hypothetical protein A7982_11497 [Minicystis rosea]|nr:Hypothetical protein A7982_11497 [Minicystis rosea]
MSWLHIHLALWAALSFVWLWGVPPSRRAAQREPLGLRLAYRGPLVTAALLIFTRTGLISFGVLAS